jgi:hypothetical protein
LAAEFNVGDLVSESASASFDINVSPATMPANAGNTNENVHPWTFPIKRKRKKQIPLTARQMTPRLLAAAANGFFLSTKAPTIVNNVPRTKAGKKESERNLNIQ